MTEYQWILLKEYIQEISLPETLADRRQITNLEKELDAQFKKKEQQ